MKTEAIRVKKIQPETVRVFGPEEEDLGYLNEYEFNDLRAQIKENKAEGYTLVFNQVLYCIDKDGRYAKPDGLFDLYGDTLSRILGF